MLVGIPHGAMDHILLELVPHDIAGWVSEPTIESISQGLIEVFKALTSIKTNIVK